MGLDSLRPNDARKNAAMTQRICEISENFYFEAAHRLPRVPAGHKCARVHGHSFRVEITLRGVVDPHLGWIVDFDELVAAWKPLHEAIDHRLLNDVAGLENPTSEMLAGWIMDRLQVKGAQVWKVKVFETCTSSATLYAASPTQPSPVNSSHGELPS